VQGILGVGVGKGSEVGAALSKAHEKARPPRAPLAPQGPYGWAVVGPGHGLMLRGG